MGDWFEQIPIDEIKKGNKGNKPNIEFPKWDPKYLWIIIVAVIFLLILIFKPWYRVEPGEVGVVMRFGKYNRTVSPGFHFRLPRPIETVLTPDVQQVRRIEIGFRTIDPGPPARYQKVLEESQMLTGDENVVIAEVIVQYRVAEPIDYLFNVYQVNDALKDITEAALRQVIGDYAIDAALTWGREEIANNVQEIVQKVSDQYGMGLHIRAVRLQETHAPEPVEPAFLEVVNSREDQSRFINEAAAYRNSEIPKAEGKVQEILQEAEAYKVERIAKSKGDVERFSRLLQEYRSAPDVMRTRLYMETMEKVLAGKSKIINSSNQDLFKLLNVTPQDLGVGRASQKGGQNQ